MRMASAVIAFGLCLATSCVRQTPTAKVPADTKAISIRVAFDRVLNPTRLSTHSGIPINIFVAEVGDKIVERQLTTDGHSSRPVWSPAGTRIAFVYRHQPSTDEPREARDEVRVRSLDTGGEIKLFATAGVVREMEWSPDGKSLAIETITAVPEDGQGPLTVSVHLLDAAGEMPPLRSFSNAGFPTWSPNGQHLALTCVPKPAEGAREYSICVAALGDSKPPQPLAVGGCRPRWSPRGQEILYLAPCGQESELFLMKSDGTDSRKLGRELRGVRNAVWSPDGERVAFQAQIMKSVSMAPPPHAFETNEEKYRRVSTRVPIEAAFSIHKDGSGLEIVGKGWALECLHPVWSPDSVSIVARCSKVEGTSDALYLLSADGKRKPRRIAQKWILTQTVAGLPQSPQ